VPTAPCAAGCKGRAFAALTSLYYEPSPWIPSTYMPTLAGRLFYLAELADQLLSEWN
jgi:glucosamine-6-phosphate deaminase